MIDYIIPTVEIIEYSLEDVIAGSRPKEPDPYDATEVIGGSGSFTEDKTEPFEPSPEIDVPDGPVNEI